MKRGQFMTVLGAVAERLAGLAPRANVTGGRGLRRLAAGKHEGRIMPSHRIALLTLAALIALVPATHAAVTRTWTSTGAGAVGYWTNNSNWDAPPYPAGTDTAKLNTGTPNTYTSIFDYSPGFTSALKELFLSNGGGGQAWLIVTNAPFYVATTTIGNGGVLRINNGGVVTNNPTLNWRDRTGTIYINNNGKLVAPCTIGYSTTVPVTGTVSRTDSVGGTWSSGSTTLDINVGGTAGYSKNMLLISGIVATNWRNVRIGIAAGASYNTLIITNNAKLYATSTQGNIIGNNNSISNKVILVDGSFLSLGNKVEMYGTGTVFAVNGSTLALAGSYSRIDIGLSATDFGQRLIISNGGLVTSVGGGNVSVKVGQGVGAKRNLYQVGGDGLSSTVTNDYVYVGVAHGANDNRMIVTNAYLNTTGAGSQIGANSTNNTATITAGGVWDLGNRNLTVSALGVRNVLYVLNGGVLRVGTGTISINTAGGGNMITNSGGVYEFTTATPTLTLNGNKMYLTDGTISFRNIASGLNMTNNTAPTYLGKLTYSGNNTLRLNNSTAANTAVGYTFTSGSAPTYKGLQMIGGSRITGNGITIGASGSILFSNNTTTAATIDGVFTNSATMTVVDSLVKFANNCVLKGGAIVWSTNAASSNLITVAGSLTTSGSISIDATKALAGNPPRVTLFTVTGAIANNAAWTVTPSPYTVKIDGKELILSKSTPGTVILIR